MILKHQYIISNNYENPKWKVKKGEKKIKEFFALIDLILHLIPHHLFLQILENHLLN